MNLQQQLDQILADLSHVIVETTLILGAIVLLMVGLIYRNAAFHKLLFLLTLLVAFGFVLQPLSDGIVLSESLIITNFSNSFGGIFICSLSLIVLFPRKEKHSLEFHFLILGLGVGALFMMKANSFLLLYLSIELVSFVSYLLTSFSFKKVGHEAAIKYLLFGAISSVLMLFGFAIIYGTTGAFYLTELSIIPLSSTLTQVGIVLVLFGIFFKISIFPFHIWVPATYQAAPIDAVAILSIVPKLAGLVLLKQVLAQLGLDYDHWIIGTILFLGIGSVLIGTFGALRQSNTRRMISFGAIAHSGFLLPFAIIGGSSSNAAFWFYAIIYSVMNMGAFYLLSLYESRGIEKNESYANVRDVWMGTAFTIILISLVGLPPLAGFSAKFFLFSLLYEFFEITNNLVFLIYLLIVIFATVVSLFFYLRVPYYIFLKTSEKEENSSSVEFNFLSKIIATIFAVSLLLLFFVPKLVMMTQQLINTHHE